MAWTGSTLLLVLTVAAPAAGVYRWIDERGRVHYTDRPPNPDTEAKRMTIAPAPGVDPELSARRERQRRLLEAIEDVPINIDIKPKDPEVVDATMALVRRMGQADRVTLTSFHATNVRRLRRAGYEGPTGATIDEVVRLKFGGPLNRLWRPGCAAVQIPRRAGAIPLDTPRFIARCHALGLRVDYWTINDPDEAIRLLECGADGIMTDDPRRIAPRFAAFRERSGAQ